MSELKIRPCSLKTAGEFIGSWHRHHGKTQGGKFAISCYSHERMCGVAVCGRPVSRYLDDGLTLEITRVCTDGTKNACSKLYGACVRIATIMGYQKVVTYTLQSENGASLKASGFKCEAERCGGTHWTGAREKEQWVLQEYKKRWVIFCGKN